MKGDLKKLQGCWNIITVAVEGQEYPANGAQIVIKGERFVSLNMGGEFEGTIVLGEKTFDLLYDKGPHAGKASLAIYELTGDEWKMCLGFAGSSRPERFATKKGTGHALQVLRRESKQTVQSEPVSDEPAELEGEWTMKSCLQNGAPMQKSMLQSMRRVFIGGGTTLFMGEQMLAKSRVKLGNSEIDYLDLGQSGIYELSAKGLKTSMAARGDKRPGDFSAELGAHRTVTEWKRSARLKQ